MPSQIPTAICWLVVVIFILHAGALSSAYGDVVGVVGSLIAGGLVLCGSLAAEPRTKIVIRVLMGILLIAAVVFRTLMTSLLTLEVPHELLLGAMILQTFGASHRSLKIVMAIAIIVLSGWSVLVDMFLLFFKA